VNKLVYLKSECEAALTNFHDACFELITECGAYHGEIVKGDIKTKDLGAILSLAFAIQHEMKEFEDYPRLKYWSHTLSSVCQDIMRKTEVDGDLYGLATLKETLQSVFHHEPGSCYEDLNVLLHEAHIERDQEKKRMLENVKQDIVEVEEKLKQVIFLIERMVQYPVVELSMG